MAIIGMFFLLLLVGVYCVALGGCVVLTVIGFAKNNIWLKLLGGIPLFLLVTGTAAAVYFGIRTYRDTGKPEAVFRHTFEFDAPADIEFYDGSYDVFLDSGPAELTFRAPAEAIQRITSNGFERIDRLAFEEKAPSDWSLRIDASNSVPGELVYFRKAPFRNFASDEALLVANTNSGLVFFHWTGID